MKRIVRNLVLLVLLAAAAAGGYYAYTRYTSNQAAIAAAAALKNIQYGTVTRGNLSASVSATGNIVSANTAKLTFRSSGIVQSVNVQVGNLVKAGDVLAKLDTTDLELALATALTNLDNAQIKYQQSAVGPKSDDINIAKANLDKSGANLAKAQSDYDKVAWMSNVGITPQAAALQQATLDYQIAQANYAKATAGSTAMDLAVLQNQVKLSQIQVDQARRNLLNATIVAPIDAVVSTAGINPGDSVTSGTVVFNLIDLKALRVDANVDETDMVKVAVGQSVSVTLDSLSGVSLPAKVTAIAPNSTVQSGVVTYLIQMTIARLDPRLRSGLTATANIIVQQKEDVLMVPNRAIKVTRNVRTVSVEEASGTVVQKQVAVGMSNDQFTEITAGLTEGEKVIIATTATNNPLSGALNGGGSPFSGGSTFGGGTTGPSPFASGT
jgi:multidrug efflux pump subunit AcrA (membrane-fusion protein)